MKYYNNKQVGDTIFEDCPCDGGKESGICLFCDNTGKIEVELHKCPNCNNIDSPQL